MERGLKQESPKKSKASLFHSIKVIEVNKIWLWPVRFVFLVIAFYFAYIVYGACSEQTFSARGNSYSFSEDPVFFTIMVILFFLISISFFEQSFKVSVKKT